MKKVKGFHRHHIIPRHAGGSDDPKNLVLLTPTEHAEAHRKLYEKYKNPYDALAYNFLIKQIDENGEYKKGFKGVGFWKGKKFSEQTRAKMSESLKNNKNAFGLKHTDKAKKAMSETRKLGGNARAKKIKYNGSVFSCIKELALFLNMPHSSIRWRVQTNPEKWGYEVLA